MTAGGEEGWHVMTLGGPGRGRAGGPALSPLPSLTSCWSSPSPPPARSRLPPSHCRSPDRRSGGGSVSPCCREQAKGHPGAQGCQGAPTHPAPRSPSQGRGQSRCRDTAAACYSGEERHSGRGGDFGPHTPGEGWQESLPGDPPRAGTFRRGRRNRTMRWGLDSLWRVCLGGQVSVGVGEG